MRHNVTTAVLRAFLSSDLFYKSAHNSRVCLICWLKQKWQFEWAPAWISHCILPSQEQQHQSPAEKPCWFVPIIHCAALFSCCIKTWVLGEDDYRAINTNCAKKKQVSPVTKDTLRQQAMVCLLIQRLCPCWFILLPARFPCIFPHHW